MTARSDDPGVSPGTSAAAAGGEIWGTWEELLLACAVRKHGTASWDSVAMEMLSRCPPAAAESLTPAGCRLRFRLLHRRFAAGVGSENGDDEEMEDPDAASADGCVEELRKLRVAELRREVERYDLSIGSLQSKVERLKEERERSISGEANPPPAVKEEEPAARKGSPDEEDDDAGVGEDRVSGGESGRSCKESNSSDLKPPEPPHDAGVTVDGDAAARAEDEERAGDDDAAAARDSLAVKREQASGESVSAGSKGTAPAEKESSDVQSSAASPSRLPDPEIAPCAGEDVEAEASAPPPPPAAVLPAAEAEALRAFLESVRTSKPGSVFERRLESQDDVKYRSTIRRHVDLETVRSRLDGGGAGSYGSATEFYRDLLLLCANALVFYPRGSPEHSAAARTRALVAKHMSAKDQPPARGKSANVGSKKAKAAEADVGSLLEKTAPIIVCRKRSSISKAAATSAGASTAREEKAETDDKEEEEEREQQKEAAAAAVGKRKAVAKDRAARGPRTNKTRGGGHGVRKASSVNQNKKAKVAAADNGSDSDDDATPEEDAKKQSAAAADRKGAGGGAGVPKKRNAVNFLNRMKQGGSSAPSTERVSLLETLKLSAAAEQKKAGGKGSEGKKEPAGGSGSGSGSKKAAPRGRNVGRPPKRAAAPPSPPPPSKRARGGGGGGKRGGRK